MNYLIDNKPAHTAILAIKTSICFGFIVNPEFVTIEFLKPRRIFFTDLQYYF